MVTNIAIKATSGSQVSIIYKYQINCSIIIKRPGLVCYDLLETLFGFHVLSFIGIIFIVINVKISSYKNASVA